MKKPKITPEKPVSTTAKAELIPTPEATKAKAEVPAATVTPTAKAEQPQAIKATPKKPGPAKKAPKKIEPVAATAVITAADRTGLTAGSIWHYLAENGASSVAKLIKELPEEEKIIQRSLGWLAQEGKITLNIVDRVETIALKE